MYDTALDELDAVVAFVNNSLHGTNARREEDMVVVEIIDNLTREVIWSIHDEFPSEFHYRAYPEENVGPTLEITHEQFVGDPDA